MAQVDTNIILGGANPQIDVSQGLRALAFGQDLAQNRQRNRLTDLALAEKQGVNNAYAGALNPDGTIDQTRLNQGLVSSGQGSAIPGAQRALTDANTSQLNLRNTERETLFRNVSMTAQLLNGVNDETSYRSALDRAKQLNIPLDGVPQSYNPNWVQQTQQQALTAQQFLSQQQQQQQQAQSQANSDREFDLRERQVNFTENNPNRTALETANGPVLINTRTGAAEPVMVDGKPLPGKGVTLNEGQSKDLLFSNRMAESDRILNDLAAQGVNRGSVIKSVAENVPLIGGALGAAANATVASPEQQKVEQAQRDFVNAILRKESGAAISQGEFDSAAKQYFPQIGDSPQVIEQKARNRQEAISGVRASIPSAYTRQQEAQGQQRAQPNQAQKTIARRGKLPDGRSVVEYSDGTREVQ